MKTVRIITTLLTCSMIFSLLKGQDHFLGVDLSYVNEMEDCGVTYYQEEQPTDPYQIFSNYGANLVRLRLWHTPTWYLSINSNIYGDLSDVEKSIRRAREEELQVLLDFHLSDNWADPSKQIAPAAWKDILEDLSTLEDSLYNYIFTTLDQLASKDLLPEMVQIGNETNRGILLSEEINNAGWTLDWERNSRLFNAAIRAVRAVEEKRKATIQIALHVADPSEIGHFLDEFIKWDVKDFEVIGISYYPQWHEPKELSEVGKMIKSLKATYPNKEILILETGFPWTNMNHDPANNILNVVPESYSPANPTNQKQFLIDLTKTVLNNGGKGVIYWEPAWVSSECATQWGKGSHYDNATFFDSNGNLLLPGGIEWLSYPYSTTTNTQEAPTTENVTITYDRNNKQIQIAGPNTINSQFIIRDTLGRILKKGSIDQAPKRVSTEGINNPVLFISIIKNGKIILSQKQIAL